MAWSTWADIATAVGVLFVVGALWQAHRQAMSDFEQAYVDRYWEINDDQIRAALCSPNDQEERRVHELRYLRLCEDEFETYLAGRIRSKTWKIWHDSIMARSTDISEALAEAPTDKRWLDVTFEHLQTCVGATRHAARNCPTRGPKPKASRQLAREPIPSEGLGNR